IIKALSYIYKQQITYIDLKLLNILISAENNIVLSNVSRIRGVTRNYLALEMLNVLDLLAKSLEAQT
ncbi:uncharacterized protein BDR25DRAFT_209244, partial [Lindgomyces ingoldianus]